MALEDMTSIFQPQETKKSNGLAEGKGLDSVTNAGSELNVDDSLLPGTGLANGTGLVQMTGKGGSDFDIDNTPQPSNGLAKQGEHK